MTRGLRILAILALIAASGSATEALFANCVEANGALYEVLQCGSRTWFAPLPADAGAVTAGWWWAVGFGNRDVLQTATLSAPGGSAWVNPGTTVNGSFIGADSGNLPPLRNDPAVTLDLVDATTIQGIGAPPGSLCFSTRANWGSPGIDSCIDINRNEGASGGTVDSPGQSDNYANRYWNGAAGDFSPYPGPDYSYDYFNHQLDPPMGVLLTEGTGKYFAAAFFATTPKPDRRNSLEPGTYSMGELKNGLPNPNHANLSVVPWQQIPNPSVSAVIAVPADPNSVRNLSWDWGDNALIGRVAPVVISDASSRPCFKAADNATPCGATAPLAYTYVGMGTVDQGPLMHYEVEMVAMDLSGNCLTTWSTVAGSKVDYPATAVVTNNIPANTCVRLKTTFGKTPVAAFIASPVTAANRTANANRAEQGQFGDLGFSLVSPATKVGGSLVSQHASLKAVSREKSSVRVVFDTDTEVSINSFDVVGIDNKGGRKVIGTVACKQCTTGLGASYNTLIPDVKLQGAKTLQIVVQPSGVQSNTLNLR